MGRSLNVSQLDRRNLMEVCRVNDGVQVGKRLNKFSIQVFSNIKRTHINRCKGKSKHLLQVCPQRGDFQSCLLVLMKLMIVLSVIQNMAIQSAWIQGNWTYFVCWKILF